MAKAAHAYTAPIPRRNSEAAALKHECLAALSIWAALPRGSRKGAKVCRQLLELRGRLAAPASSITEEAAYA